MSIRLNTPCFKKRTPFLFLRLVCVLSKHTFQILYWCMFFDSNPSRITPSTATVDANIMQHNLTLKAVTTQFEMNAKHSKRRSDQAIKMSCTSFRTRSPQRMLGNDIAVFVCEFGAMHGLQQWVLAQDASSCISTSNSDKRFDIPKSYEFLSLVKFDVLFCNSLVHLPDSKSVTEGINVVISALCEPASMKPYRTASVSQFS